MKEVVIIGGGINSAVGKAHIACLKLLSNKFKIVGGVFSRDRKINSETGNKIPLEKDQIYTSYEEMLLSLKGRSIMVIILSPTDQHYQHISLALELGFDILCEKAVTSSVEECRKLIELEKKSKGKIYVMYNYLGYPMVNEMKKRIPLLGHIHTLNIRMPQETFLRLVNDQPLTPQDWRLKDNGEISKISLDLGVHLHILIKYLLDERIIEVVSHAKSAGYFNEVVDDVNALLIGENGCIINMWYSKTAIGNRNGQAIEIYGKMGSLKWVQEYPEELYYATPDGEKRLIDLASPNLFINKEDIDTLTLFKPGHPIGFTEAMKNYYQDIYLDLFQGNSQKTYGLNEALEGLTLLEGIERSSKERIWIRIQ